MSLTTVMIGSIFLRQSKRLLLQRSGNAVRPVLRHRTCGTPLVRKTKNVDFQPIGDKLSGRSRCLTSCCSMKSKDSNDVKEEEESLKDVQKALDDDEFRSILQDFTKDFGFGNDSSRELDEIKNQIESSENHLKHFNRNISIEPDVANKSLDSHPVLPPETFKAFRDKDASVIYSYEEELLGLHEGIEKDYHITHEEEIVYNKQQAKRGIFGVYDIEDLVAVLRNENVFDISVISIPKSFSYADYMVIATAKSPRHAKAVTEFILKLYKMKKHLSDPFIIIEGEKVSTWKAMDMGNIVLHVFLEDKRECYDIESLWLFDRDFDSGGEAQSDPMLENIEEQMAFFNSLQEPKGLTDGTT